MSIAAGYYYSLVLDNNGFVMSFGKNHKSQLGLDLPELTQDQLIPTRISTIPPSNRVLIHNSSSFVIDQQGQLWVFGDNQAFPQISSGIPLPFSSFSLKSLNGPYVVENLPGIAEVGIGDNHGLILDILGQVWGYGYSGSLGLGLNYQQIRPYNDNIPMVIPNLPPIKYISANGYHSLALDYEGQVWVFGSNKYGQLGLGEINHIYTPVIIPNIPRIVAISTSSRHTLLLSEDGQVWVCGSNEKGELGFDDEYDRIFPEVIPELPSIKSISAGLHYSLLLDDEGYVWSFGDNYAGQLGLNDTVNRSTPTIIPDLPEIIAISAGTSHSLIMDVEGQVYSFGENDHGQLGLGDLISRTTPQIIPNLHSGLFPRVSMEVPPIITYTDLSNIEISDYTIHSSIPESTDLWLEFTDTQGQNYLSRVQYDPDNGIIYPPTGI